MGCRGRESAATAAKARGGKGLGGVRGCPQKAGRGLAWNYSTASDRLFNERRASSGKSKPSLACFCTFRSSNPKAATLRKLKLG